jgi:hypothetical protein
VRDNDEKAVPELSTLRALGHRYERARVALESVVSERDEAIVAAARAGASRASIAAAAGVTVARAQQVLAQNAAVRPYRRQQQPDNRA